MSRFQRLARIGIVLATCLGGVEPSFAQSNSLTAFYTAHVVSMAPMWIAKETGLFKKYGADVRLVYIGSGPIGTTSILAGEADIAVGVKAAIAEMGSPTMKEMGTVMKNAMARFNAAGMRVDGKVVSEMVKKELAGK